MHPLAEPFVADGDPGPRTARVGVLLSHGFTGSPASMKPWAEHLAAHGYAVSVPRLPGHGTTWQEMNKTTWADWYAEVERAFEALRQPGRHRRGRAGSRWAAAWRCGSPPTTRDASPAWCWSTPRSATDRKDVKLLPVLKHLMPAMPGIANDIKKPGVQEHGYTKTPLKAAALDVPGLQGSCAPTCGQDHLPDPALPLHRGPRRRPLSRPAPSRPSVSLDATCASEMLENSYHVATLDNDAQQIFEGSLAFVERVAGHLGASGGRAEP